MKTVNCNRDAAKCHLVTKPWRQSWEVQQSEGQRVASAGWPKGQTTGIARVTQQTGANVPNNVHVKKKTRHPDRGAMGKN